MQSGKFAVHNPRAYKKAREILDGEDKEKQRELLLQFVNKIIVYKGSVEIFVNLIPFNLQGSSVDISFDTLDYASENGSKSVLDSSAEGGLLEFAENNTEEVGQVPTSSVFEFIGNSLNGSLYWIRTCESTNSYRRKNLSHLLKIALFYDTPIDILLFETL